MQAQDVQPLINRHDMQVANTPEDHVTRDYQEGTASLADMQFKVIDTSGAVLLTFLLIARQDSCTCITYMSLSRSVHEPCTLAVAVILACLPGLATITQHGP